MLGDALASVAESMQKLIFTLLVLCAIFVPLGIWKLVELVIWLFQHITVSVGVN